MLAKMGYAELPPGSLFANRFEIQRAAGSGGMGTVFRALDRFSGELVALKLLHAGTGGIDEGDRFTREAALLSELRHPGVVGHVAHGQTPGGQRFLAMEWLDGEDLGHRLARGPLSVQHSVQLLTKTADALSAAHQRGIIHRDLKPTNLFLPDGEVDKVKILDFGIARRMAASRAVTRTGMVIGTAESFTTIRMRAHTEHGNVVKIAVGYVRVSTLEQASEGVSLDAQRDKLRAYCKFNGIKLIDIAADEGVSGGTLERPGLQHALGMLKRGRANTLVVMKLDRLTRSVRDLCALVDSYFGQERYHLLSVCGMVNTHNAAGRMMMLNLANYAQFEREIISERTYEAMQQLKAQGVKMGGSPYGYEFSQVLDDKGRRTLVPHAGEQAMIARMATLHAGGVGFTDIARQFNAEGLRARRGGEWHGRVVSVILQREGKYTVRPHKEYAPRPPIVRDQTAAATRSRELRAEGLSLRGIAAQLRKEGLYPPRARAWHAATVQHLLRYYSKPDLPDATRRAAELRAEGLSFSEIGLRLASEGHIPGRGGFWYASRVSALLRANRQSASTDRSSAPVPSA